MWLFHRLFCMYFRFLPTALYSVVARPANHAITCFGHTMQDTSETEINYKKCLKRQILL